MKKNNLLAIAALGAAITASLGFYAVGCNKEHSHSYGQWNITVDPTDTTTGVAKRWCTADDGNYEEFVLPVLTDTDFWTITETVSASHTAVGHVIYSSEYGTVTVTLPQESHTFGSWEITEEPTLTQTGTAVRYCMENDNGEDSVSIPALSDTSVWTITETVSASHTAAGHVIYSSEYGTVTVTLPQESHTFGAWEITEKPTLTQTGTAVRYCTENDNGEDSVSIPALSDTSVWSKTSEPANYNEGSVDTYTSVYGTVEINNDDKLVAPYDNKTYYNFAIYTGSNYSTGSAVGTSWNAASLALNEYGVGVGTGYPYRYQAHVSMVDAETGKVNIEFVNWDYDNDTVATGDKAGKVSYEGYVDFTSGVIVFNDGRYDFVLTPYTTLDSSENTVALSTAETSAWEYTNELNLTDTATVIAYAYDSENVLNIYIAADGTVYFNVTFTDISGNAVAAQDCSTASALYIKDADGNTIAAFGYDGEKVNILDGLEGTYSDSQGINGALVISGFGKLSVGGVDGTYTVTDGVLEAYVGNSYYEITLSGNEYVSVKPMVDISFDAGASGSVEAEQVSYNKNIAIELPTPTTTDNTIMFAGWYTDADFTQAVALDAESLYTPTGSVTLYAKWINKVVVSVYVNDDDVRTLYIGTGETLKDYLDALNVPSVDEENWVKFAGWYLNADYSTAVQETVAIPAGIEELSIYAKWNDLPAYYGEYKGVNTYGNSSGTSTSTTVQLNIDEDGVISGKFSGTVISYDAETQVIIWQKADSSTNYFWFDKDAGIIVSAYSSTSTSTIGTDLYTFVRGQSVPVVANYALSYKADGSTGYYTRFVKINTAEGEKIILIYNDRIYSDITVTNTAGDALDVSSYTSTNIPANHIAASKTVVVRDSDGNIILGLASNKETFATSSATIVALDSYWGTYTADDGSTVILDGTGTITYGDETGTYSAVADEDYLEVYFYTTQETENVNYAYYHLTLDTVNKSFTLSEVKVTVTYVSDYNQPEAQIVYKNIAMELPEMANTETHVFRGWYADGVLVEDGYEPAGTVTLTALWLEKVTLTVNYNQADGVEDTVVEYGVGETAVIENPKKSGMKFDGWYTTATFEEGSEWASGSQIDENVVIYAKWSEAEAWYHDYTITRITDTSANGGAGTLYTYTSAPLLSFDPDGYASALKANPFNNSNAITIEYVNRATGEIQIINGSNVYRGYLDSSSGIIIIQYLLSGTLNQVMLLNPFETASLNTTKVSTSYWNSGYSRAIQYTYDSTTYSIFVHNEVVYFNVSFKSALTGGEDVVGSACRTADALYVFAEDGTEIARFAYNGTTMVELDGYEGTYTGTLDGEEVSLVINGISTATVGEIDGVYSAAGEGASYGFDVYLNGSYYEVSLDKDTYTFTSAKPMVTITYSTAYDSAASVSVNKNIAINLPELTDDTHVFRGWYVEGDETQTLVSSKAYVPTAPVTLVAKWDIKVTLTVVYGNGIDSVIYEYGVGDVTAPAQPSFTNGQVFNGWYLDADCTEGNEYTVGVINENTTIYAKWMDAVAYYGTYSGAEVWGTTNGPTSYATNGKTLTIDAVGKCSGNISNTVSNYDETTGTLKVGSYVGAFDAENGVFVYNYSSGGTGLSTDVYIFILGQSAATTAKTTGGCTWDKGYTRLVAFTLDDGSVMNVFIYNNRVYGNVTFTSEALGSDVTIANAYSAADLTVYDSNGNVIASFVQGTSGLTAVVEE